MEKGQLAFGKIPSYRRYELFMERYRSAVEDFIEPYVEKSFNDRDIKLLDVGAGEGYLKYFFNHKNIDFHGVELDPARQKACRDLDYKIWSFDLEKEAFPFPDNHFEVVVASHVLEHLYNPKPVMDEISRVLKPNGIAVIGLPMHVHWISSILQFKNKLFPAPPYEHHQFFSMKKVRAFFANYEILDTRGFRLISSRRKFNWEDNLKFYKFNTWWGKKFPHLTPEVNIILKKNS